MAAAELTAFYKPKTPLRSVPVRQMALAWVLTIPWVFLAVHGNFSFEGVGPARNLGFIGYVVIPGAAYGTIVWLLLVYAGSIWRFLPHVKLLFGFALFTALSAAWSQAPFRSFYNGFFFSVGTLFGFFLILRFTPQNLMRLCMLGGAVTAALSLLVQVVDPEAGISTIARSYGAWQGLFVDRTTSAKALIFLISPGVVFLLRRFTWKRALYVLVLGVMIVRAEAVSALLLLMIYISAFVVLRYARRFGRRSLTVIVLVVVPPLALFGYIAAGHFGEFLSAFGRDPTLTGRTDIWASLTRSIFKRPLLGYGFYGFWLGLSGESASTIIENDWFFGYAHNGYLELVLQLGFVGLGIFIVTLLQAFRNAWYCVKKGYLENVEWYLGILLLTLIYNVDESTILLPNELQTILYMVACAGLMKTALEIRSEEEMPAGA